MTNEKENQKMVTMKVSVEVHSAIKLLKRRYNAEGRGLKLAESLWQFIEEHDPQLAKDASRVSELRAELDDLLGEEDDD